MRKIKLTFPILIATSILLFLVSVLLHNLIYGLFGVEEAFFFIIAVFVCPVGFLVGVVGFVWRSGYPGIRD
ncbi:hypothetical protein ACFL5U_02360 [Candidatus Margulisiibacteriota bacterium]